MDGSAGVDRGHEAKMEGDAHRRSLKGHNTKGRRETRPLYSQRFVRFYTFTVVNTQRHKLKYELTLIIKQTVVTFQMLISCYTNSRGEVTTPRTVGWSFSSPLWSI